MALDKILDEAEKKVGDKVEIIDIGFLAYLIDYETEKQLMGASMCSADVRKHYDLLENEAIVVETGLEFVYNCGHCDEDHYHNCVIFFPHNNAKYITSQNMLELV